MKAIVLESAQKALDRKTDLSGETWLTVEDGRAVGMDFPAYAGAITRMKTAPAFDGLELETAENDLFGSENVNCRHFTKYSLEHSKKRGEMAPEQVVRMLNPMSYVDAADAQKAKYFRIRQCWSQSCAHRAVAWITMRRGECRMRATMIWTSCLHGSMKSAGDRVVRFRSRERRGKG